MQAQLDALADDRQWRGGWYQPIEFPDGSRTHSTKLPDAEFYGRDSAGMRKWDRAIRPHLPCSLEGARFLEIGCNAGLYLAQARKEGATVVVGIESHPLFARQARLVLSVLCPEAVLVECEAREYDFAYGPFDLALLSNALYWMVYSDERGFVPDHRNEMRRLLRRLAGAARHVLVIGAECGLRYADLESSSTVLREHFILTKCEVLPLDRTLNIIAGRSRYC